MFNDTQPLPKLECAFTQSVDHVAGDIHANRKKVIDHYFQPGNRGGDVDEFVMAASLIAGKVLDLKASDDLVMKLSPSSADAYFHIADTIHINSSRCVVEAVMVDAGLLPDSKGRVATTFTSPIENPPPAHDM